MKSACAIIYCVLSVACPAVQYFTKIIKKTMEPKTCVVLFVKLLSETLPILTPIVHFVKNVHRCSCKVSIILVECKLHLNSLDGFLKHRLIRKFMKFRPVGTELFYADGQTDRQANRRADRYYELIVTCRNFANDPVNNRGSSLGKEGKIK